MYCITNTKHLKSRVHKKDLVDNRVYTGWAKYIIIKYGITNMLEW